MDVAYDYDTTAGNVDGVQLGAGVAPSDVVVTRDPDNMYLSIKGTTDRLTLIYWFAYEANRVEQVRFADGTVWGVDVLRDKANAASDGNDTLYSGAASDSLSGLGGDDRLYGNAGNDTLDGGAGNDMLDGGVGNDTYVFGRGSGVDVAYDYDTTAGNVDGVQLGAGVAPSDVVVARDLDSMHLSIKGTTDRLTLINWFAYEANRVEQVRFADGTVWGVDVLQSKVNSPTVGNDLLSGGEGADTLLGLEGDDVLYGKAGNDVLDGGLGRDNLFGGGGADRFVFSVALNTTNTDYINDFNTSEGDTIALSSSVFTKLAGKTNVSGHFRLSTQAAQGGDDYLVYNPSNGQLSYDATGSGATGAVFVTLLNKPQTITPSQFVVI